MLAGLQQARILPQDLLERIPGCAREGWVHPRYRARTIGYDHRIGGCFQRRGLQLQSSRRSLPTAAARLPG